ncbi:uncharacterized protein LOC143161704 isoform X1 [Aptenodytes patagonicus]|uniref:uncharacterized protein LOC143161704 isoform X1 n=1 Tax=Aptenodytes patagonicus TaxID=9234 RepID=UPI003FA0794D
MRDAREQHGGAPATGGGQPSDRSYRRGREERRKGGEKEKETSELANSPSSAESCGGGQPSDRSYRRGRDESRRKKHLNWQILLAAPRVRAACPAPCSSFLATSTSAQQPITPGGDRPPVHSPLD